jgi:hypothetical protein
MSIKLILQTHPSSGFRFSHDRAIAIDSAADHCAVVPARLSPVAIERTEKISVVACAVKHVTSAGRKSDGRLQRDSCELQGCRRSWCDRPVTP